MVYFVLVLGLLVLQFVFFSYQVGVQRVKTGTKAPSMDGPESFMRALRVQMNTLEGLVTTIPAMLMLYMLNKPVWAAIGGFIYLIDRLDAQLELKIPLVAPLQQNDALGTVRLSLDGEQIDSRPIVALQAVPEGGLWTRFTHGVSLWFDGLFD